jgi:hypothetical protein
MTLPMLLSWILCAVLQTTVPTPPFAPLDLPAATLSAPEKADTPSPTEPAKSELAAQLSALAAALKSGARVIDPQQILPAKTRLPLLAAIKRLAGSSGVEVVVVILPPESVYLHDAKRFDLIDNMAKKEIGENYVIILIEYYYSHFNTVMAPAKQLKLTIEHCELEKKWPYHEIARNLGSSLLSSIEDISECLDPHKNPVYVRYHRFLASPEEQSALITSLEKSTSLHLQAAIFVISLITGLGIGYRRAKADGGLFLASYALIFLVWAISSVLLDCYRHKYNRAIDASGPLTTLLCWLTMRCFVVFDGPRIGFLLAFCLWLPPLIGALYVYPNNLGSEESGFIFFYFIVVAVLISAVQWFRLPPSGNESEPGDGPYCSACSGE